MFNPFRALAGRLRRFGLLGPRTHGTLDWSNYTGIPTVSQVRQLVADGWTGVILGTQNTEICKAQYAVCQAGGLKVEALYTFVYWDEPNDIKRLQFALELAELWDLKVWLDCEWVTTNNHLLGWVDVPMPAAPAILGLIHTYVAQLGPRIAGIYTGRWWWVPYTRNSIEFSDLALWYADYMHGPVDLLTFISFGGWLRCKLWQYSEEGVDGITADLNVEADDIPLEDSTMMIRHNAVFPAQGNFNLSGSVSVQISEADNPLPPDTRMVRLEVFLTAGSLTLSDGGSGAYAGQVHRMVEPVYIDVGVGTDGYFTLTGSAHIRLLGVVGRWAAPS